LEILNKVFSLLQASTALANAFATEEAAFFGGKKEILQWWEDSRSSV